MSDEGISLICLKEKHHECKRTSCRCLCHFSGDRELLFPLPPITTRSFLRDLPEAEKIRLDFVLKQQEVNLLQQGERT